MEDHSWNFSDRLAFALACLAGFLALILCWIDKTPLTAAISSASMAFLLVYPILHFVRSRSRRIAAFVLSAIFIGIFAWKILPKRTEGSSRRMNSPTPSKLADSLVSTPSEVLPLAPVQGLRAVQTPVRKHIPEPAKNAIGDAARSGGNAYAPNGIAVSDGTVQNATVNNFGPPPATVGWRILPPNDPADTNVRVQITVDQLLDPPAFYAVCDRPCQLVQVIADGWTKVEWMGNQNPEKGRVPNGTTTASRRICTTVDVHRGR